MIERAEVAVAAPDVKPGDFVYVGDRDWSGYRMNREWVNVIDVRDLRQGEREPEERVHVFVDYYDPELGAPPQKWAFFADPDEQIRVAR